MLEQKNDRDGDLPSSIFSKSFDPVKPNHFDAIIVGAGIMGSATASALSRRGAKVLVLDKYKTPGPHGSSHGHTRLIRKAYFEHPDYVPLLKSSYELWGALEKRLSQTLIYQTGLALFGRLNHPVMQGCLDSASKHQLELKNITPNEYSKHLRQFKVPPEYSCLFENEAGCILVEPALSCFQEDAENHGCRFQFFEAVEKWTSDSSGVAVTTAKGQYFAKSLIIAAGPWMTSLAMSKQVKLDVRRVPVFWFPSPPEFKAEAGFPAFAFATDKGFFYGFPDIAGAGLKVGLHLPLETVPEPDYLLQATTKSDIEPLQVFLRDVLPQIDTSPTASSVCMYTLTADEHFIVDKHPEFSNVMIASPCSGHGFKFAPVIGEVLADLASSGRTAHPIDFLRIDRPGMI